MSFQTGHDRHPEIMLKLIDAQLIAAREKAAISTARQFIVRHTEHPQIVGVHRRLASLLERDDKLSAAAQELALAYESPQGHLADAASAVQLYCPEAVIGRLPKRPDWLFGSLLKTLIL